MIEHKEFLVMVCFGIFSNNRLKCLCASHLSQSCSKPPGVSSCSSIILLDFSFLHTFLSRTWIYLFYILLYFFQCYLRFRSGTCSFSLKLVWCTNLTPAVQYSNPGVITPMCLSIIPGSYS